jgi:hypothetical protein
LGSIMNMAYYLETCEDSVQKIIRYNDLAKLRGEIQDANVKRERMYRFVQIHTERPGVL